MRAAALAALAVSLIASITGCGAPLAGETDAPPRRTLTVLAAASLTDAFSDLERTFEASHPDVDVVLSFAGSQALAAQIRHGIPADVFASADERHIAALAEEGLVDAPRRFAANRLVLALSERVAAEVTLETLPEVESLVVGGESVPAGRYTELLLDAAGERYGARWREAVEARVVSREPSVRLAAAKVSLGEADAAIVYATDLGAIDGARAVALPPSLSPEATYLQAPLADPIDPELARAWIALVESPVGQSALAGRGFRSAASAL